MSIFVGTVALDKDSFNQVIKGLPLKNLLNVIKPEFRKFFSGIAEVPVGGFIKFDKMACFTIHQNDAEICLVCDGFKNFGYPISVIDLLAKDRVVKSEMRD